jgi:acylphosphatase
MSLKRYAAVVFGNVQGVGFRYFTRRTAQQLGCTGWVRNREDGAVELEAQADEYVIQSFCEELKEGPGYVSELKMNELPVVPGEKGFGIKF